MPTLLLNASYEPLAAVSLGRAVSLVVDGRAETLETTGRILHSPSIELEEPAVIRLRHYVTIPPDVRARPLPVSRLAVLERDGWTCAYCGMFGDTIDHVVPRARGGATTWRNLVAACLDCNATKRDHTLSDLGWVLKVTPGPYRRPRGFLHRGRLPRQWRPYLGAAA